MVLKTALKELDPHFHGDDGKVRATYRHIKRCSMKWDAEKYDSVKAPQIDAGWELIAMAQVRENDSILDIGCGTGKLTLELARLAFGGAVIGIDPSREMLNKAREVTGAAGNVRLDLIPAEAMDFEGAFDLAFSNSALQWVKEQKKALALTFRSLKKGGRIAFQLPAKGFCKEFSHSVEHAILSLGYERFYQGWQSPWYFPSKEEYETWLARAGFQNIRAFYKDYHLSFGTIPEAVSWWSSAGLRPYLAALPEPAQEHFKEAFSESFEQCRTEKGIEFGFRRIFAFAEKQR